MGILIRNIRLPENCYECFCCNQTYQDKGDGDELICTCNILTQDTTCFSSERREDCPLVEVPTPHGRLIDSNELKDLIEDEFDGVCTYDVSPDEAVSDFQSIVDKCKTIIKMEE